MAREAEVRLSINGIALDSSLKDLGKLARDLKTEIKELTPGTEAFVNKSKELGIVQQRIKAVNQEVRSYSGEVSRASSLTQALGNTARQVGVAMAGMFALDKAGEFANNIDTAARSMIDLRREVQLLTGATGENLDKLSTQVKALSDTFNLDFNEVIKSGNVLSKEFGTNFGDSLKIVETSLLNVSAVQRDEILSQMNEYSVQAKQAGLTIDQFAGVLIKSSNMGVFSDKGIDTIKEFGLRIREQTKATGDALTGAFGAQFTQKLFADLNKGSINTVQALEQVAGKLQSTGITASKAQTVIADVFGGPGEDAGLPFIQSLANVSKGTAEATKETAKFSAEKKATLTLNQQLASAQNDLAKEYKGFAQSVDTASKTLQVWIFQGIVAGIRSVRDFVTYLYENRSALMLLVTAYLAYNSQIIANTVATTANTVITRVSNALTYAGTIAVSAYTTVMQLLTSATVRQNAVQLIMNTLMRANPIGLLITAVGALGAGFTYLYQQTGSVIGVLKGLGSATVAVFTNLSKLASLDFSGYANSVRQAYNDASGISEEQNRAFAKRLSDFKARMEKDDADRIARQKKAQQDAQAKAKQQAQQQSEAEKQAYQEALKRQEEYNQKLLQARQNLEDAKNSLIQDQFDREIAQTNTEINRKVEAVKKDGVLVNQQIEVLELTRSQKVAEINTKRLENTLKAQEEEHKKTIEQAKAFVEEETNLALAQNESAYLRKVEQTNQLFEAGQIGEQERQALIDEARFEREQADLQAEMTKNQGLLAVQIMSNQEDSLLAQQHANEIIEIEQKKNDAILKHQEQTNAKKTENEKRTAELKKQLQQQELQAVTGFFEAGIALLSLDEASRKKHADAIKAFTIANIAVNLASEIQGIWENANLNPTNVLVPGWGTAFATVQTGLAIARGAKAVADVVNTKYADGGLLSGPSHAQKGIRGTGSFADVEVEGGEYITNKRATANNLPTLQHINANPNTIFDVVPRTQFREGGQLGSVPAGLPTNTAQTAQVQVSDMTAMLVAKMDMLIQATIQNGADIRNIKLQISLLQLQEDLAELEARQTETTSRG